MSSNLQAEPIPTYVAVVAFLALLIPVCWVLSISNGVDPFGCPPGTKTIRSPMSLEKLCLEN